MVNNIIPAEFQRFPKEWEILPFSSVIEDRTGGNPKVKKSDYKDSGELAVVDQGQSVVAGYVDDLSLSCKEELPCLLFGDHTRIFKFVRESFALGADGVKVLVPKNGFDKRFLFHYLQQVRLPDNAGYSRHFKFLKETFIPKPPLKEQKRIAAILDKADAIRRKRQQVIQLADQFLRAVFLDIFGDPVTNPKRWKTYQLGDCLEFLTSGSRGWAKYYSDSGSYFIRIQNVSRNKLLLDDIAYVNAPEGAEAHRIKVQVGDVLLSITADLGRSAVVTEEISGGYINQHLALLRVDQEKINPRYLAAYLSSDGGVKQFQAKNKSGVKAGLNFTDINTLIIPVPQMALQREYEYIYGKVIYTGQNTAKSMDGFDRLFSSISQRAFSGEL